MNIQADISWIQSELNKVKDPDIITAIKSVLKYRERTQVKDWWDEISEDEKASIEIGLAQADNGETISHEQVMKKYQKWR
jgi:predicted transcriptional regulator